MCSRRIWAINSPCYTFVTPDLAIGASVVPSISGNIKGRSGYPLRPYCSPTWTRTKNPPINSRMLCQLSYGGINGDHKNSKRLSLGNPQVRCLVKLAILTMQDLPGLGFLGHLSRHWHQRPHSRRSHRDCAAEQLLNIANHQVNQVAR